MPAAFLLLVAAIASLWAPALRLGRRRVAPWIVLFIASLATGLATGVLAWPAAVAGAAFAGLAWSAVASSRQTIRAMLTGLVVMLALALAFHMVPGFSNPALAKGLRLTEEAAPFSLYVNVDKALVGLVLMAFFARRVQGRSGWLPLLRPALAGIFATTTAVMLAALAAGFVAFEPKLPNLTGEFLLLNLFVVSMAEEAFFRGLIQERIAALAERYGWRPWLPIGTSALLFGLVHLPAGSTFAVLATLAGLGYALVYQQTRSIEPAVLTHFSVNATHFLLFTYPSLGR